MAEKLHAVFNLTNRKLNQIHAQLIKNPKPHILNPLLGSLSNSPTPQNALLLYNQMLLHPTSHNHYTFTHALKACFSLPAHQKGLEIHAHVLKCGHYSDIFIQNSLLHFYVIVNDVVSACQVFDSISYPDVVSWTSIISGLSKCGFEEEAIVKFSSMDVEPNSTTLVSVISACSSLGAFKLGKAIHGFSYDLYGYIDGTTPCPSSIIAIAYVGHLVAAAKTSSAAWTNFRFQTSSTGMSRTDISAAARTHETSIFLRNLYEKLTKRAANLANCSSSSQSGSQTGTSSQKRVL
ncbi:hypothetical protein FEM48_Zijuj02G0195200 [Ziziphus jujuba var. spinosa]|uniref:Pentatricopeptide repeat-containing protein n=1 Tax=Ziziphus jujuba var. spinosa TaxID=714518 RepID=A0A978VXJ9_ZIZJJ|nr:hypothetical protein FEM48_Zijuj02G0195200 [Ziziphus jujuba var. spinosa]